MQNICAARIRIFATNFHHGIGATACVGEKRRPFVISSFLFLTLFGQFLFSFFRFNEYIIRVAHLLLEGLSHLAKAVPIIEFTVMQMLEDVRVYFRLQLRVKPLNRRLYFGVMIPAC